MGNLNKREDVCEESTSRSSWELDFKDKFVSMQKVLKSVRSFLHELFEDTWYL